MACSTSRWLPTTATTGKRERHRHRPNGRAVRPWGYPELAPNFASPHAREMIQRTTGRRGSFNSA